MREQKYFTIRYDDAKDQFQIWITTSDPDNEDEWGFCYGCTCMRQVDDNGKEYGDAELVHYSILTKVRTLLQQGWKYYNW